MPGTVTVAYKGPSGLYLRAFKMEKFVEQVMGGGLRDSERAIQVGSAIEIAGIATKFGVAPKTEVGGRPVTYVAGYALTHNVDADLWASWHAANVNSDLVRAGLIFAYDKSIMAEGKARENESVRSGLEPIKPDDDIRMPQAVRTMDRTDRAA